MAYEKKLKDCRIIVRDMSTGKTIADTIIEEYDWRKNIVAISAMSLKNKECEKISALIIGNEGLYEFLGNIRRINLVDEVEIALYKGKEKEGRKCRRYEYTAHGIVENVKILNNNIKLHKPIDVDMVNMSANGILIRTFTGSFSRNDEIQINLKLNEKDIILKCEIMRIQNTTLWTEEYGCRTQAIYGA
ncbi:MAG: PilZ domain-containing protein [Lachnospiraceae bacterium]